MQLQTRSKIFVLAILLGLLLLTVLIFKNRSQPGKSAVFPSPTLAVNFVPQAEREEIKQAVQEALLKVISGLRSEDIEIISLSSKNWPDACLGVEMPERVCAQVITPGYQVKVLAASKVYEIHVDQALGQFVILDSQGQILQEQEE